MNLYIYIYKFIFRIYNIFNHFNIWYAYYNCPFYFKLYIILRLIMIHLIIFIPKLGFLNSRGMNLINPIIESLQKIQVY